MVANIAYRNGRAMAVYGDGEPAWHQLGTVVAGAFSPEDAMRIAQTDYTVETAPLLARIGDQLVEVEGSRATYRTDNNAILGVVSDDYRIIQNVTPMHLLMDIVGTKEAGLVAHAALGKGERLFAVLDLRRLTDIVIPGDPSTHDAYLVAQWWHTGTGAFTVGPSLTRTACQNMANAQLSYAEGRGQLVRVAHVGDMANTLDEARRILGYAERKVLGFVELMKGLAEQPIRHDGWISEYTERLIPIPAEMERPALRLAAREGIKDLYLHSKTLVGVPDTAYRAFQATTEYADHYRPLRTAEPVLAATRRFTSTVDGPAADLKERALRLLREEFEV
jgi:phage/plasmid-like protein (TIGR03299 family)